MSTWGKLPEYDKPKQQAYGSSYHDSASTSSSNPSDWSIVSEDHVLVPDKIDRRTLGPDVVLVMLHVTKQTLMPETTSFNNSMNDDTVIVKTHQWGQNNDQEGKVLHALMIERKPDEWIVQLKKERTGEYLEMVVSHDEIQSTIATVYHTPRYADSKSENSSWNTLAAALLGDERDGLSHIHFSQAIAAVAIALGRLGQYLVCQWKFSQDMGTMLVLPLQEAHKQEESSSPKLVYVDVYDLSRRIILGPIERQATFDKLDPLEMRECNDIFLCAEGHREIPIVPYKSFMAMEQWTPPNCQREWTRDNSAAGVAIFLSHPWLSREHPDPDRVQLRQIQKALPRYLEEVAKFVVGEESAISSWNDRRDGLVYTDAYRGWTYEKVLETLEEESGVWLDFLVVPNDPAHEDCPKCIENKRLHMLDIGFLTSILPVVYVGETKDMERGWIVAELNGGNRTSAGRIVDDEIQALNYFPSMIPMITGRTVFTQPADFKLVLQQFLEKMAMGPRCWAYHNTSYVREFEKGDPKYAYKYVTVMVNGFIDPRRRGILSDEDRMKSWMRAHLRILFRRAAQGETASLLKALQLFHEHEYPAIQATVSRRKDIDDSQAMLMASHWHSARLQLFSCAVRGSRCIVEGKSLGEAYWTELAQLYQHLVGHCGTWRQKPETDELVFTPQDVLESAKWYHAEMQACKCGAQTTAFVKLK